MDIDFDPSKDATNRTKHGGTSLAEAARIDWEWTIVKIDDRRDYGERRWIGVGPIGARLYVVIYVERGATRRIISLRKANAREYRAYEHATKADPADC